MTEVSFHFNADKRLDYACRLLRKVVHKGFRVLVLTRSEDLALLDGALWTFAPGEFLPHALASDPSSLHRRAPVILTDRPEVREHKAEVLVNLSGCMPEGYDGFDRVIEVVTTEAHDRGMARGRWRHYRAAGHHPLQHDVSRA